MAQQWYNSEYSKEEWERQKAVERQLARDYPTPTPPPQTPEPVRHPRSYWEARERGSSGCMVWGILLSGGVLYALAKLFV